MAADFSFMNGASRVIIIDNNWRLDFVKSKLPKVETINFDELEKGETIVSTLKKMVHGGPDVALECVGMQPYSFDNHDPLANSLQLASTLNLSRTRQKWP